MTAPEMELQGKDRPTASELYMSMELGDKHWKLTFGNGSHRPSRCTVAAGDEASVLERIGKTKLRFGLSAAAAVRSCYEAGRDGWWLHRRLREHGVDNIVVDSASIEVNRRARRAKTDRLDGDKLLCMLQRYGGTPGRHVCGRWCPSLRRSRKTIAACTVNCSSVGRTHVAHQSHRVATDAEQPASAPCRRTRLEPLVGQPSRAGAAGAAL